MAKPKFQLDYFQEFMITLPFNAVILSMTLGSYKALYNWENF